jgi:hypothetical protein
MMWHVFGAEPPETVCTPDPWEEGVETLQSCLTAYNTGPGKYMYCIGIEDASTGESIDLGCRPTLLPP